MCNPHKDARREDTETETERMKYSLKRLHKIGWNFIMLRSVDILTTLFALTYFNVKEGNPLMDYLLFNHGVYMFLLVQFIITMYVFYVLYNTKKHWLRSVLIFVMIPLGYIVAANNLMIIIWNLL